MSKWQDFIARIKNPPPERLARVEYQSHFLNICGVMIVSLILVLKGYWYVTLAFIFSVGVSYSQGMTALQKYRILTETFEEPKTIQEQVIDIETEISPMRRRTKTIVLIAGRYYGWLIMILAVSLSAVLINPYRTGLLKQIMFTILILPTYLILYFGVSYTLIKRIYNKKYGRKKETREAQDVNKGETGIAAQRP